MTRAARARHYEMSVSVPAPAGAVFDQVDDLPRLAGHMEKSSAMMLGGRMAYQFDAAKGRATGSVIRMTGSVLGVNLWVEEVVTVRDPPRRKVWETRGVTRLLIIGGYQMGFEIDPVGTDASKLRVFIDYGSPPGLFGLLAGAVFGPLYARWCVRRMARDTRQHFVELRAGT